MYEYHIRINAKTKLNLNGNRQLRMKVLQHLVEDMFDTDDVEVEIKTASKTNLRRAKTNIETL